MIKFSKQVDIKGSLLLLSFSSVGLTGNFASSVLINNHNFQNVGFLFSHYLSSYVTMNPQTGAITFNGQVYFNEENKILLINFHSGVPHHYRNLFCTELLDIYQTNAMRGLIFYGGIAKSFLNDEELRNKNVEVYYLTNDETFDGTKNSTKNFENLVKLEDKKKPLEEIKYLEHIGTAKHLFKFLTKKKVNFIYFFAYSGALFDPQAGLAVYNRLALLLGLTNENLVVPKYSENLNNFLESVEKRFKIEPVWRLFLKE